MTTPQAAALYAAQHMDEMARRGYAVYNPHNKPVVELPIIYGFNNGGSDGWYHAQLLSEDGMGLGSHICSAECYMEQDLGILEGTRPDRHETFKEHYPDGYRMEFVRNFQGFDTHEGLKKAYELNQERAKESNRD